MPVEQDRSGTATQRFARFIGAGEGPKGPEAEFALPHVLQFSGIIGGTWRTYYHGQYDEAIRFSQEDALAMRNDAWLMSLLNERKRAVATLERDIEVDNPRDPVQKALANGLSQIMKNIPRQTDLAWSGLEAIWFGRAADQFVYKYKNIQVPSMPRMASAPGVPATMVASEGEYETRRVLCMQNHLPIEGDKVDYDYDGNPYILVSPIVALNVYRSAGADLRNFRGGKWVPEQEAPEPTTPDLNAKHASLGFTTMGGKALFLKGNWRNRFRIHTHEAIDSSYWQPWKAGSLHGVGIRSVVFWYWWLRQEYLANVTDWAARTGLGIKLWYYEQGNAASKNAILSAAKDQTDRVNIAVPYDPTKPNRPAVDIVEMAGTGADLLLTIVKHVEEYIERYVLGQNMTGGSDDFSAGFGDKGRADLAGRTNWQITKLDARKFDDTNTSDVLEPIKRYSYPEYAEIPTRLVSRVDDPDIKKWVEGAKAFVDMGGEIVEDEGRAKLGLSKPRPSDKTIGGAAALQAKQATSGHVKPPDGMGNGGENGQQSGQDEKPSPLEHAAETAGNLRFQGERPESYGWITIGGHEEGDSKHVGGFHVEIDKDGKVMRGGASVMHGKPIHQAVEALQDLDKKKEAESKSETHKVVKNTDREFMTTFDVGGKRFDFAAAKEGNAWDVTFSTETGDVAMQGDQQTSAFEVLSKVGSSIGDLIDKKNPEEITFSANGAEKSRGPLYDRMAKKLAEKHGYTASSSVDAYGDTHFKLTKNNSSAQPQEQDANLHLDPQAKPLSPQERDDLAGKNMKLARTVSGQMASKFPGSDRDQLESDAMLGLVNAARNYDPSDGPFEAFASVTMRNAMRDGMRKEQKTRGSQAGGATSLASKEGQNIDVEAPRPTERHGPQMAEVDDAIATLPEQTRRIIEERKQGKAFADIATLLGTTPGAVKTQASRAYKTLKELLPQHQFNSIAHLFDDEVDRYEYGPRHHPQASVKGAVLRLRALKEHHIDGEVLEAELDSIAREFTADELRQIAEQCEVKAASTKWETLANLREYVEDRKQAVEKHSEEELYQEYREMIERML